MKLFFYYKFRFYTSKLNEICLHCHWLYFSSIIMSFGQGDHPCLSYFTALFLYFLPIFICRISHTTNVHVGYKRTHHLDEDQPRWRSRNWFWTGLDNSWSLNDPQLLKTVWKWMSLINVLCTTFSDHFFTICMFIFHKTKYLTFSGVLLKKKKKLKSWKKSSNFSKILLHKSYFELI